MTGLILKATNARKTFAGPKGSPVVAADGVDLEVETGEFVALSGPSGCGKSTILFIAGGLLRPDEGEVDIMGERSEEHTSELQALVNLV